MEQVRIVKEMRQHDRSIGRTGSLVRPRFLVLENVTGAFSSNFKDGFGDFGAVLEEIIRIAEPTFSLPRLQGKQKWTKAGAIDGDGWSVAWRTHDAKYWGVPQRRRRIALVADFGGESAGEILLEREGLSGNTEPGKPQRKEAAGYVEESSGADDREGEGFDGYNGDLTGDVSATLGVNCGVSTGRNGVIERRGDRGLDAVAFEPGIAAREGGHVYEGVSGTLRANAGDNRQAVAYTLKIRSGVAVDSSGKAAGKGPLIQTEKTGTLSTVQDQYLFQPMAYSFDSLASNSMKSKNPHSGCRQVDIAKTLDTIDPNPCKNQGGIAIVETVGILDSIGGQAERGWEGLVAPTLKATHYKCAPCVAIPAAGFCTEHSAQAGNIGFQEEIEPTIGLNGGHVSPTLISRMASAVGTTQDNLIVCEQMLAEPIVYDGANITSPVNASNPQPGDPSHTLSTDNRNILIEPIYCLQGNGIDRADTAGCNGKGWKEDTSYTLNTIDRPAVAYCTDVGFFNSQENVSPTLLARQYKDPHLISYKEADVYYIVRRLTPLECERLQGFPDGWTDIGDWIDSKGKKHKGDADSPRYKALGNSIALPFWYWMFKNMAKHLPDDATLGSLFDGIGGFPICWEAIQGKGTARWASEIEEFPIAVTKIRFPDNNDL